MVVAASAISCHPPLVVFVDVVAVVALLLHQ